MTAVLMRQYVLHSDNGGTTDIILNNEYHYVESINMQINFLGRYRLREISHRNAILICKR